ncbi:MAG: hypothetical protein K9J06_13020 [Flavobacteriales bacterium]|nr:hypothetical protein [Flavobacteriales bacterium]
MKKIFAIVAFSSLALTAAHAQSSGIPSFSSETEKKAWIEAHPEQYRQAVNEGKTEYRPAQQTVKPVAATEVKSSQTRTATVKTVSNAPARQPQVQNAQRIDVRNAQAQPAPAAPVRAVNADLESKRLPANYPNAENRTSKSDQ